MKDVTNIIVLVGGTVDPVNISPSKRSRSYSVNTMNPGSDLNYYWGENPALTERIQALQAQHTNVHVLTAHGWSGDNSVVCRRIAGSYLANRLCGSNGEKAYYEKFLDEEVSFHFIGHSHGGNVINEVTRRAAEILQRGPRRSPGSWPSRWKVRSITYLSTPFFKRHHKVVTAILHPECKIINVYNEFDLTQRVIADFSLNQLGELTTTFRADYIGEQLGQIHIDSKALVDSLPSVASIALVPAFAHLKKIQAAKFYGSCILALDKLDYVLSVALAGVMALNRRVNNQRFMSDALAQLARTELEGIHRAVYRASKAFKARRNEGKYPLSGLLSDLGTVVNELLRLITRFIQVDSTTLAGPLWNIICQLLQEQIDAFDDTCNSPAAQLASTKFANRIVPVNVTTSDGYDKYNNKFIYDRFINYLQTAEGRYDVKQTPRGLMDIVFTLVAQTDQALALVHFRNWLHKIRVALEIFDFFSTSPIIDSLKEISKTLEAYVHIFKARNFGQLDKPSQALSPQNLFIAVQDHTAVRRPVYHPHPTVKAPARPVPVSKIPSDFGRNQLAPALQDHTAVRRPVYPFPTVKASPKPAPASKAPYDFGRNQLAPALQDHTAVRRVIPIFPDPIPPLRPATNLPMNPQGKQAPPAPEKQGSPPACGTLDYFMRVSHSVSRQTLYPEVEAVLNEQIDSELRRPHVKDPAPEGPGTFRSS